MSAKNKQLGMLLGVAVVAAVVAALVVVLLTGNRSPQPAQAQTPPTSTNASQNSITVSGEGTVVVKPDIVRVSIGVNEKGQSVGAVQKQAADKLQAVKDSLLKNGIKEEDIQTTAYNITPEYNYNNNGQPPTFTGYHIINQLTVTIRDVTKAGSIIDAAGASGATQINGISFDIANEADAVKQARVAALEDAKNKAGQLAQAGSVSLGSVINISEYSGGSQPQVLQKQTASGASAAPVAQDMATSIEGGQLRVRVNITVQYAIK